MNSLKKNREKGAVLLVSMIMLIVMTLLVVFAIRSGNTNLRIAGNMQSQAEAGAATEQIKVTEDLSLIAAQSIPVSMGNVTYTVAVLPLNKCLMDIPVLNSALNPANANDLACFENPDEDKAINADGTLSTKLSACKTQQWDIEAGVTDATSGTKVTLVQGISIRVPSIVNCS
jgi:hypothetical protein